MKIKATYLLYPNAVRVSSTYGAFDSDGNQIAVDEAAIAAKVAQLELEKSWSDLREKRDRLIAETDWEIVKHKELGTDIPTALTTYRQDLRDLPANTSDPSNRSWPVKP